MQKHPWFAEYGDAIPHEIDLSEYASIADILDQSFKKYADDPCFTCMGKTFTYGEIDTLSKRFGHYLQSHMKLKKGDRIALMMPNLLQYPIALFGALRAGLVVVNVNPLYTARELEHQLKDAQAQVIVICTTSAAILDKVVEHYPISKIITTSIGEMQSFPKSHIVDFVVKYVKKMVPDWQLEGSISFKNALALGDEKLFKAEKMSHDDLAFLQYTGGTTGVAKGAMLTHKNMVANMLQARAWLGPLLAKHPKHTIVTPLPLYHIFSLTANCFTFSSIGAHNVLITNPRDIAGFVKELSKYKFTALTGVNTLFNALANDDNFKKLDFSNFLVTLGGGMAVQKAVAEKWIDITGIPLIEAYGLTETSPAVCINPLDIPSYNGKIGVPISSTIVKILDENDNEVPTGEAGELAVKGPQVMQGYWERPEETAKVMTSDGYFKTGDVAFMDDKGYFKIVDRKKDMILVSGFNVYPNEVEDVVVSHPKVLEAAAIGVPHEKSGEIVKVFVVKRDDSLTIDELRDFCKQELTGYKVPKLVEFRKDLPKTNVGKILRRALKEEQAT